MNYLVGVILLLKLLAHVLGYPDGAPEVSYRACQTLVPGHSAKNQTKLEPPAKLSIAKEFVTPGELVKVVLKTSDPKRFFKGFIIQAREGKNPDKRTGSWMIDEKYGHAMNCAEGIKPGYNNSVTHSSREKKDYIEALWKAPENFSADDQVVFKYSVVQEYDTVWAFLESHVKIRFRFQGARNFH